MTLGISSFQSDDSISRITAKLESQHQCFIQIIFFTNILPPISPTSYKEVVIA